MNRHITVLGLVVLLIAIGFILYPLVLNGAEELDSEVEAGIFILPVGLTVILWGAASPDPSVTTVGGVFGNPDEDLVRQWEERKQAPREARFIPSPRETINCVQCYTAIPPESLACLRCGKERPCRSCGTGLTVVNGVVRCVRCGREEIYCSCPRVKRVARASPVHRTGRR
ncbi:MAG: hypothetical protein L3K19_03775 [Thermoplasmata archaeon]|nr:hypothetical protein [Thermoplasmata archaeon]